MVKKGYGIVDGPSVDYSQIHRWDFQSFLFIFTIARIKQVVNFVTSTNVSLYAI